MSVRKQTRLLQGEREKEMTISHSDMDIVNQNKARDLMLPCVMCGQHEQITEYHEDNLMYYCPSHDQYVSVAEYDRHLLGISEAEQIALDALEETAYAYRPMS